MSVIDLAPPRSDPRAAKRGGEQRDPVEQPFTGLRPAAAAPPPAAACAVPVADFLWFSRHVSCKEVHAPPAFSPAPLIGRAAAGVGGAPRLQPLAYVHKH